MTTADWQTLETARGAVQAWRAEPQAPARGAVIVVQEIFGVTQHIRDVCQRIAGAGFVAIAPAFFDRFQPPTELPYDRGGASRGKSLVNKLGLDGSMEIVRSAAERLQADGFKVGVVGFCWGGTVAFLGNTRLGLPAVSYYGARNLPFLAETARAPLMFHFGSRDESIPAEAVAAHRDQQPQAQSFVYDGADHAFNRDGSAAFDPAAAALAWQRTLAFLGEHLR